MIFHVTDRTERAILQSLYKEYDKCEQCGEPYVTDEHAFDVSIVAAISGGMSELVCKKCGHIHMESFQFDYMPTLQRALMQEISGGSTVNNSKPAMPQATHTATAPSSTPHKPRNIQEAAMERLRKRKEGHN